MFKVNQQQGTRKKEHACLCCFLSPRWNTLRLNQTTVKTTITHNNFRHCHVSFPPQCTCSFMLVFAVIHKRRLTPFRKKGLNDPADNFVFYHDYYSLFRFYIVTNALFKSLMCSSYRNIASMGFLIVQIWPILVQSGFHFCSWKPQSFGFGVLRGFAGFLQYSLWISVSQCPIHFTFFLVLLGKLHPAIALTLPSSHFLS